ncbi:hypothetical protein [Candidatus Manganitrophus noduliformans]|uniref:hypothetical protein n=1 Tax=Candidatus Manganitrophus noduliformans TaxID=2606439 RepID=UPI00143B9E69|nr:hypothetical protein [Candidatus Manganitrophus noduliformans]
MPRNLDGNNALRFVDAVAQGKVNHENASEFVKGLLGMSGDPAEVNETFMEKGKPDE